MIDSIQSRLIPLIVFQSPARVKASKNSRHGTSSHCAMPSRTRATPSMSSLPAVNRHCLRRRKTPTPRQGIARLSPRPRAGNPSPAGNVQRRKVIHVHGVRRDSEPASGSTSLYFRNGQRQFLSLFYSAGRHCIRPAIVSALLAVARHDKGRTCRPMLLVPRRPQPSGRMSPHVCGCIGQRASLPSPQVPTPASGFNGSAA